MIKNKIKILIVDDDNVDRAISNRILKNVKEILFDIVEASTCSEAINMLSKNEFDCILLDYQLPDSNGIELIEKIKEKSDNKIPIIMLTGQGSEDVAVNAMKSGVNDYISKNKMDPNYLVKTILNSIKENYLKKIIEDQKNKIKYFSYYESLTGLLNRHTFEEILSHYLSDAKKTNQGVSVVLIDIDNFVAINDKVGHLAGNAMLIEVGNRLRSIFSKETIIARYGEDEFAVLLKFNQIEIEELAKLAELISKKLSFPYELSTGDTFNNVTISIGISYNSEENGSIDSILKSANQQLTLAKESGSPHILNKFV